VIKLRDNRRHAAASYHRRAGSATQGGHRLRLLNPRRATRAMADAEPGPGGDVTKLLLTEQSQHLTELGMDLAGPAAVTGQTPRLATAYFGDRAMTITDGTSEITRNAIAKRILGLPVTRRPSNGGASAVITMKPRTRHRAPDCDKLQGRG
jgi:3-oxochol-4-en-24-oyl-CoA dehydrogenase